MEEPIEESIPDGFEVFDGYDKHDPEVMIKSNGSFVLNRSAYELLVEPQSVSVFYHKEKRVIGVRAGSHIPVHPSSRTTRNHFSFAGKAFMIHYGIDTSISRKYSAKLEDDMLLIDLNLEVKKQVAEEG